MGRVAGLEKSKATKRLIPIKIIDMQMDVNQAGTVYNLVAIPWVEFGFVDTYNKLRTSGDLYPQNSRIKDVAVALERLLNKQNQDEEGSQAEKGKSDEYRVVIDKRLNPDHFINIDLLSQTGMYRQEQVSGEPPTAFMRLTSGMAVTKILEELMKGTPDFTDQKYEEFREKCATGLGAVQEQGGAQAVYEKAKDFFFDYFRVRTQVETLYEFDKVRATNRKRITYIVEPFKVHAYSLALPGVSTGDNFNAFVFKTYNYIFTGENINILDLNINYRVAYFLSLIHI